MSHMTVEIEQLREGTRDHKAVTGEVAPVARQIIDNHELAAELSTAYAAAIKRLQSAELVVAPDLDELVDEVTKDLPAKCFCGARLDARQEALALVMGATR